MSKTYRVNEGYYSLQGEGMRAGTANTFVRFTGCNLKCTKEPGDKSPGGFDCDTEFESGRNVTKEAIAKWIEETHGNRIVASDWIILTGGEPGLQVDAELIDYFKTRGFKLAIETNGSIELPAGLDWITVSPKVAEHAIRQLTANEVKYVRGYGQAIPKTAVKADHYLISPAFDGMHVDNKTMQWCIDLVKDHPKWRLSVQQHKAINIR